MHYLWANRLQLRPGMKTVDNQPIEIIDPGRHNTDSGPDFFNAKIRIGDETWAGNIEIHVRASDWYRHGHQDDRAYDTVILHVVGQSDTRITASDGRVIPQIELPCDSRAMSRMTTLRSGATSESLPCADTIDEMEPMYLSDWLSALAFERIYEKADRVDAIRSHLDGDWEETAYILLARALGFSTNSDPFERLARSTPLRLLRKHADASLTVEAILMGQGGLLPADAPADSYPSTLRREYDFMARKFSLSPPPLQWKMARMRPANFPLRRIALLAQIVSRTPSIMSRILAVRSYDDAVALFNQPLGGYWSRAYTFNTLPADDATIHTALSRSSVMSLIINVVVPLKVAWGAYRGADDVADEAIAMLQDTAPEDNRLTRLFAGTRIRHDSAFISQALIQLRRRYCESSDCLRCRIGHRSLKSHVVSRSTRRE